MKETVKIFFENLSEEQQKKIAECKTEEELTEVLKDMEGELSDDAAGEATGGFAFATLIPYHPEVIQSLSELASELIKRSEEPGESITETEE